MRNQIFLAAISVFTASLAAERPEISWSIMHPTAIDTNYMARVVAKAVEYGGVDSFEVCGDCHRGYSGINGLSFLERYPHAAAKVDRAAVERNRRDMSAICRMAHSIGKPLYYWHREIFIPDGLLEDLPGLLDENGEFDLLGKAYRDWLRYKLDETFRACPELDGIVLTLTEADYSVIHNSSPERYPPQKVVEELVGLFAGELERRGRRFILRSFGSNSQDYRDIVGGAAAAAARHGFEVETKVTEADFVPWLPINPFLKKTPPLTLGAECDALGEYLGAGYLPAAQVAKIREYVDAARSAGADRYAIRIDRVGNSIFDSAHEVNLYAYMRFIADASATPDGVLAEYAARRFGRAADAMASLMKDELEMVRSVHYVASNLVFHSFPIKADFKFLKAGGIFSLYRENASLEAARDIWSILSDAKAPSHEQVLAEKARGVKMATEALARLESLEGAMPAEEYARQRRAFAAAVKAARALEAFAKCCVAYFEDMMAKKGEPDRLAAAGQSAEGLIESLMSDPDAKPVDSGYFNVVGDDLDQVYMTGLRALCRELLREYRIERAQRARLEARADVADFVVPGGIYDDGRTIRTMHGAYAKTLPDRVVRYAGNPVFPNGTISVKFADVPGAKVEVELDPDGAQSCAVAESVKDGVRTVTIGKKGRGYPGVLSVALVKATSDGGDVDVSFARGMWNPDDFLYVKSWRWDFMEKFKQVDDAIVNVLPGPSAEEVFKKMNAESYVAMMHRRRLGIGCTVSSKMSWDWRMAPIVVIAPDVGTSAKGVPELRDHWEVCLYDEGINVWYHYFEGGVQKWYKDASIALPKDRLYGANEVHDLKVHLAVNRKGNREMTVTCGDYRLTCVDPRFPDTFYAGVIGCEGRNWFYDFRVARDGKRPSGAKAASGAKSPSGAKDAVPARAPFAVPARAPDIEDDFDGPALDSSKWTDWVASFPGRSAGFLFARDNVAVTNGCLRLTARLMRDGERTEENLRRGFTKYATAYVRAREKTFYGYYECRAKTMRSKVCNAFWLYDPLSDRPERKFRPGDFSEEIDVFEIFGALRDWYGTVHRLRTPYLEGVVNGGVEKLPEKSRKVRLDFDPAADFHTYGFRWAKDRLAWFVDGKEVFSRANDRFHRPMHVTFDCEIMYDWVGEPEAGDLPDVFEIDSFRHWRED